MQPRKLAKRPYWVWCLGTLTSALATGKIKNLHRLDDDVGVARRVS